MVDADWPVHTEEDYEDLDDQLWAKQRHFWRVLIEPQ